MALLHDTISITASKHDSVEIRVRLAKKHHLDWTRNGVEVMIYPTKGSETSNDSFRLLLSLAEAQTLYGFLALAVLDLEDLESQQQKG